MMTDKDDIDKIITNSGGSFHCKVVNYLREKGWHVLISPYYMEWSANKPREIDLIAEKAWNDPAGKKTGTVNIKLFIECKYISQKNVFWFDGKDILPTKQLVVSNIPFGERSTSLNKHHYLSTNPKVAKIFASKRKPDAENEVIYKALNQSLNAMIYQRRQGSIIPETPNQNNNILTSVKMPVILCNSFEKFYRIEMEGTDEYEPNPIQENFQLEVNYAYRDSRTQLFKKEFILRNEFFLIDVVDFNKIDKFLELIEADKDAIFQIATEKNYAPSH